MLATHFPSLEVIIATITVVSLLVFYIFGFSFKRYPPGPWGLPLLGYIPFLGANTFQTIQRLRRKYGNIYSLKLGSWPAVIISGREFITQASYNKTDAFSDRCPLYSTNYVGRMKGLSFCKFDDRYLLHRKIAMSTFKMFTGVSNNPIQEIIHEEAEVLLNEFLDQNGKSFNPKHMIRVSIGSIIYQVCYGRGKNIREDPALMYTIQHGADFDEFQRLGNPFDTINWMKYFFPKKYKSFEAIVKQRQKFRMEKVQRHKATFDAQHLRDITDGLINATLEYTDEEKKKVGLTDLQILSTLGDFVGAGFGLSSVTFRWGILFLANYPEIQRKVRAEIDDVIGFSRSPVINDKTKLPYLEATVNEILRLSTSSPMGINRMTNRDVTLGGYKIPKGTLVYFNLYSIAMDEDVWENPHEFKPERFLDEQGKVKKDLLESIHPFGIGRRRCAGESLARLELFLFFSYIIQKCEIHKPEGTEYDLEGIFTSSNIPKPLEIVVKRR